MFSVWRCAALNKLFLILAGFLFFFCFYKFVAFRLFVLHPFKSFYYFIKDVYFYFKYKEYNRYSGGVIAGYIADAFGPVFGSGKTLSIAEYIEVLFKKYHNKPVWDRSRKKFVTQKVHIISNIDFTFCDIEPFTSLSQIVNCAESNKSIDLNNDTITVLLVVIDESSTCLNSRAYKDIPPNFINSLVTSRHYQMSIFYSSQKFKMTDLLLRECSSMVIGCRKHWRYMCQYYYNADELEFSPNPTLVQPYRSTGFFVTDHHYSIYDTLAMVKQIKKSIDSNDFMTEEEIINMRGNMNVDTEGYTHRKSFFRRRKGA